MLLHRELEERGYRLILASQSPRRRELMSGAGLNFSVVSYDVDEVYPAALHVDEVACYLSQLKSAAYTDELSDRDILITADTVVLLGDKVLGKPHGSSGARAMLNELSGSVHRVVTGVTIRSRGRSLSFSSETMVRFVTLSSDQIDYYVAEYSPLDKAGSYGIQEWIGYVGIESIEGSFYNVMGLPIQRLCSELSTFIG